MMVGKGGGGGGCGSGCGVVAAQVAGGSAGVLAVCCVRCRIHLSCQGEATVQEGGGVLGGELVGRKGPSWGWGGMGVPVFFQCASSA